MKNLVEIIKANPGCIVEVNNDCWKILKADADFEGWKPEGWEDWDWERLEAWMQSQILASSDDEIEGGDSHGHYYGRDVLRALATMAGIQARFV